MSEERFHKFSVDLDKIIGQIKPLNGVNLGPITMSGMLDLSEWHRELKIPYTRLHDCPFAVPGAVDIHYIFPRFDADIDDPDNYNFAISDDYIQSILDVGSNIVFRLGESIEHYKRRKYFVHPPKDYDRWARICINIIRHYNEGWAEGFRHGIKYWEIWCEPWVQPTLWTGTDEEWFELYAVTAKAIHAHDSKLKIGCDIINGGVDWLTAANDKDIPFDTKFLDYVDEHQLPLDFIAWHSYSDTTSHIFRCSKSLREELDRRGLKKTESHLNEWNHHPHNEWHWVNETAKWGKDVFIEATNHIGASFDAEMLIGMQDHHIDVANFYWAKEGWWGLFDCWGGPQKNYYAFLAFAQLLDTPKRLATTGTNHGKGHAILAGINKDGSEVNIMISRFRAAGEVVELNLENLPWEGGSRFEVKILDETRTLEVTRRGKIGDRNLCKIDILQPLDKFAVMLVNLRPLA